jgi:hypothetical protein
MNNLPQVRHENIVVKDLENEVLIYDLTSHKAYTLNETSAIVWNLCDGKTSVPQITQQLAKQLNMPVGEEIVWLALDSFKKENLLTDSENIEIDYQGLSRRQVIRKVGLASMIALPIVSSLIAPSASYASSVRGTQLNGTTCTNPGGGAVCASGFCTPTRGPAAAGFPNTGTRCCYANTAPPGSILFAPGGGVPASGTTSSTTCANNAPSCCSGTTNFSPTVGNQGNCTCGT